MISSNISEVNLNSFKPTRTKPTGINHSVLPKENGPKPKLPKGIGPKPKLSAWKPIGVK